MDPIESRHKAFMNAFASYLDQTLNDEAGKKTPEWGFALLIFKMNEPLAGRMNWISNAERKSMIVALTEMVAQLEGRAHDTGGRA